MGTAIEKCKLCGHEVKKLDKPAVPEYYHCVSCDLVLLGENSHVSAGEELKRYLYHNNSPDNKGYADFLRGFIRDAGIESMRDVGAALDFGCGPRPVLQKLLYETGIDVVDIYDPFFFPGEDFKNKKYDLITCTEVFEHLKNPAETIALLRDRLTDRGLLAVKTLFHTTCDSFEKWWYRQDVTHVSFYSPATFKWIAVNCGFGIRIIDERSICVLERI